MWIHRVSQLPSVAKPDWTVIELPLKFVMRRYYGVKTLNELPYAAVPPFFALSKRWSAQLAGIPPALLRSVTPPTFPRTSVSRFFRTSPSTYLIYIVPAL